MNNKLTYSTEQEWSKKKWYHFDKKEGLKIFRAVNSNYCTIFFSPYNLRYGEEGRKFLAEVHTFTQKLVTERFQKIIGSKDIDFRIDFLINNLYEYKAACKKGERFNIMKYIPDEHKPLVFVDSGGLQLFRIRLGLINGDEQEFINSIPELIERQEKAGDVLFCMDYIPMWERGKPLKKSDLEYCAMKTIEFTLDQLTKMKEDNTDSRLLPILQMAQLPPHCFRWLELMQEYIEFSDWYICGISQTGFNRTGNLPNEHTLLYNVAMLTKLQNEIYNKVNRPFMLTHILGLMLARNEFLLYGMLNGNFNHVSVDAVTMTNAYHKGYFYEFNLKNISLNGFGEEYRTAVAKVYAIYGDFLKKYLNFSYEGIIKDAISFHSGENRTDRTRQAAETLKAVFTYYHQLVVSQYFASRVELIADKYGKIFNQIKEDPDYYLKKLMVGMVQVPMIDDTKTTSSVSNIEELF